MILAQSLNPNWKKLLLGQFIGILKILIFSCGKYVSLNIYHAVVEFLNTICTHTSGDKDKLLETTKVCLLFNLLNYHQDSDQLFRAALVKLQNFVNQKQKTKESSSGNQMMKTFF